MIQLVSHGMINNFVGVHFKVGPGRHSWSKAWGGQHAHVDRWQVPPKSGYPREDVGRSLHTSAWYQWCWEKSPYLPIPSHQRRDKAHTRLGEMFANIVRSHKNSGLIGVDVLQNFIVTVHRWTLHVRRWNHRLTRRLVIWWASLEFKHHHLDGSLSTRPLTRVCPSGTRRLLYRVRPIKEVENYKDSKMTWRQRRKTLIRIRLGSL
jgi:hypothetical protein